MTQNSFSFVMDVWNIRIKLVLMYLSIYCDEISSLIARTRLGRLICPWIFTRREIFLAICNSIMTEDPLGGKGSFREDAFLEALILLPFFHIRFRVNKKPIFERSKIDNNFEVLKIIVDYLTIQLFILFYIIFIILLYSSSLLLYNSITFYIRFLYYILNLPSIRWSIY